eukprot:g1128.t1
MKTGLCFLLLVLVAAQARELTKYTTTTHVVSRPTQTIYTNCRKEVGYKIVAKPARCGAAHCGNAKRCLVEFSATNRRVYSTEYYPIDKCPQYGFRYYKCDPIVIACGKTHCGFGYKCGEKKVCSTDYKTYNDGHKTTVETKKCWYEKACIKEDPPLVCEYSGKYKRCYVDPKYAAIAAGVSCGTARCPPGHTCSAGCKVCDYEVLAHPYCDAISRYSPIPCGSGVLTAYQRCDADVRTVCSGHDNRGYVYYANGQHATNHGRVYYPFTSATRVQGSTVNTYYYTEKGGYYYSNVVTGGGAGSGARRSTGAQGTRAAGTRATGTRAANTGATRGTGTRTAPASPASTATASPSPSPSPSTSPPPPPVATAQSASVATDAGTNAATGITATGTAGAASQAGALTDNAVSESIVASLANGGFTAETTTGSNSPFETAQATAAADINRLIDG